jgi:hypothetical protein
MVVSICIGVLVGELRSKRRETKTEYEREQRKKSVGKPHGAV